MGLLVLFLNSDESELWLRLITDDEDEFMPPKGEPLNKVRWL